MDIADILKKKNYPSCFPQKEVEKIVSPINRPSMFFFNGSLRPSPWDFCGGICFQRGDAESYEEDENEDNDQTIKWISNDDDS